MSGIGKYPKVKFEAAVQQENDRHGMLQCQAVSSDLWGLTWSGEEPKKMERRGGSSRGQPSRLEEMHTDTDEM